MANLLLSFSLIFSSISLQFSLGNHSNATIEWSLASADITNQIADMSSQEYPGERRAPSYWSDRKGNVFLFGGSQSNSIWHFNGTSRLWHEIPSNSTLKPESRMGALLCGNQDASRIFLYAGKPYSGGKSTSSSAWIYHTGNSTWSQIHFDSQPAAGWFFFTQSWCDSKNGYLYLFSGHVKDFKLVDGLWRFSFETLTFEHLAVVGDSPSLRFDGMTWMTPSGLWLFSGLTAKGGYEYTPDMWKFDTEKFTWTSILKQDGNKNGDYGEVGVAAKGHHPGGRQGGFAFVGPCGNLWLYGGTGFGAPPPKRILLLESGVLNDLWMFDVGLGVWVWMGGQKEIEGMGHLGDHPWCSPRAQGAVWSIGHAAFVFAGFGHDVHGDDGIQGDLWKLEMSVDCMAKGNATKGPVVSSSMSPMRNASGSTVAPSVGVNGTVAADVVGVSTSGKPTERHVAETHDVSDNGSLVSEVLDSAKLNESVATENATAESFTSSVGSGQPTISPSVEVKVVSTAASVETTVRSGNTRTPTAALESVTSELAAAKSGTTVSQAAEASSKVSVRTENPGTTTAAKPLATTEAVSVTKENSTKGEPTTVNTTSSTGKSVATSEGSETITPEVPVATEKVTATQTVKDVPTSKVSVFTENSTVGTTGEPTTTNVDAKTTLKVPTNTEKSNKTSSVPVGGTQSANDVTTETPSKVPELTDNSRQTPSASAEPTTASAVSDETARGTIAVAVTETLHDLKTPIADESETLSRPKEVLSTSSPSSAGIPVTVALTHGTSTETLTTSAATTNSVTTQPPTSVPPSTKNAIHNAVIGSSETASVKPTRDNNVKVTSHPSTTIAIRKSTSSAQSVELTEAVETSQSATSHVARPKPTARKTPNGREEGKSTWFESSAALPLATLGVATLCVLLIITAIFCGRKRKPDPGERRERFRYQKVASEEGYEW